MSTEFMYMNMYKSKINYFEWRRMILSLGFSLNSMAVIWKKKEVKILCSLFYILFLPCVLDFVNRKRQEITEFVAHT